jgi:hypothetical protein
MRKDRQKLAHPTPLSKAIHFQVLAILPNELSFPHRDGEIPTWGQLLEIGLWLHSVVLPQPVLCE